MTRTFDADFMLFDLAFTIIWIIILWRRGYVKPLLFGLLGILINFIIDFGVWYSYLGIRTVDGLPNLISPLSFFVYFSITYGMIQYSYVQVMFARKPQDPYQEKKDRVEWSLFLFVGWLLIGFLSNVTPINDLDVTVTRVMTNQRIFEVYAVIAEYSLLAILAYMKKFELTPRRILYIFSVGLFVHFSMEFTLLLSGIRGSSLFDLLFNSIFEFNMGAPILYLMLFALVPFIEKRRTPLAAYVETKP
ncbi:MAG: hypothetical protein ACFFDV_05930 [Candidatus Thorarchaeota archaeon]